jgi:8-hydroxy-5-deazaflavin:NADPH oxidoreductase
MPAAKRVGILGSGDVGKQLGRGFAQHGFDVMLGSREPAKLDTWRKETKGKVSTGSFAQAAAHGEFVILALHGAAVEAALDLAGVQNFAGKLVLDATNPLDFSHGMPPGLFLGTTDSLGERVQKKLPQAKVVKCFNTVGNAKMIDPKFKEGVPPMLICGNDAGAKKQTDALLREVGWPGAMDVGGIEGARWLEAIVPLWVRAGQVLNTYEHAFKVVR